MKIWDLEKWVFRLSIFATIAVFILLAPSTYVVSRWVPERRETLWLLPLGVTAVSSFFWFLVRLAIPFLIRIGFFEERRTLARPGVKIFPDRAVRIGVPIANLCLHFIILISFCFCLVRFLRSDRLGSIFSNIP